LHTDNKTVVKERIFLDKVNPNILHDEITTFDNALTRPSGESTASPSRMARRQGNCERHGADQASCKHGRLSLLGNSLHSGRVIARLRRAGTGRMRHRRRVAAHPATQKFPAGGEVTPPSRTPGSVPMCRSRP
jgi:hypothetical protein